MIGELAFLGVVGIIAAVVFLVFVFKNRNKEQVRDFKEQVRDLKEELKSARIAYEQEQQQSARLRAALTDVEQGNTANNVLTAQIALTDYSQYKQRQLESYT